MDWLAQITGRGTAIAGEILDGKIRIADRIVAPASVPGIPLEIIGVEFADNTSTREFWVTLVVAPPPTGPATQALKDAMSAGTILEITSQIGGARGTPKRASQSARTEQAAVFSLTLYRIRPWMMPPRYSVSPPSCLASLS